MTLSEDGSMISKVIKKINLPVFYFLLINCTLTSNVYAQTKPAASAPTAVLSPKQQLLERFWTAYYAVVSEQKPVIRILEKYQGDFPNDPNIGKYIKEPRVIEKYKAIVKKRFVMFTDQAFNETDLNYLAVLFESNVLKRFDQVERKVWDRNDLPSGQVQKLLEEVAQMDREAEAARAKEAAAKAAATKANANVQSQSPPGSKPLTTPVPASKK